MMLVELVFVSGGVALLCSETLGNITFDASFKKWDVKTKEVSKYSCFNRKSNKKIKNILVPWLRVSKSNSALHFLAHTG